MESINKKELLTVKEMMEFLKIGRTKAYELINTKGFPVIRISTICRIPMDDLLIWLNANMVS